LVQAIAALAFVHACASSPDFVAGAHGATKHDGGATGTAAARQHDAGGAGDAGGAVPDGGAADADGSRIRTDAGGMLDAAGPACGDAGCPGQFAVCPQGLEPSYDSIRTRVFAVSCGAEGSICHSAAGGNDSGGLHLAGDPYPELLGNDGQGARASNIAGSARNLLRVVPGDPDHSFLVIKLSTKTSADADYGAGMPFTSPGSVCPEALATIRAWIADGAKR
jgi:hypothetical protein